MEPEQIELYSTQELIDELFSRHPSAVFCGIQPEIGSEQGVIGQWAGNAVMCVGLCQAMIHNAIRHCEFEEEIEDTEEDE
jgi:hypothetical protein